MTTTDPDPWTLNRPTALPTGRRFSAVRVALPLANAALNRLQGRLGPVFAHRDVAYFMLPPTAGREPWPGTARFCGAGTFVAVPEYSARYTSPYILRWLISPSETKQQFTDELVLRAALGALAEEHSTAPPAEAVAQAGA